MHEELHFRTLRRKWGGSATPLRYLPREVSFPVVGCSLADSTAISLAVRNGRSTLISVKHLRLLQHSAGAPSIAEIKFGYTLMSRPLTLDGLPKFVRDKSYIPIKLIRNKDLKGAVTFGVTSR